MVDLTALAALLVSLVALVVAFMQVVQQYAATGYDYRRCSARTMGGGWASRTHRKFVWREVRLEVTFSTPSIEISIDSSDGEEQSQRVDVLPFPNEEEHALSVDTKRRSARYRCMEVPSLILSYKTESAPKWFRMEDKPKAWFLRAEGTIPEAKCSWLDFLQDLASTDLKITLTETRKSYDFVPEGVQRPVADVDRNSFLTPMSLFGIQWNSKGIDGKFTGASHSGFFEILSTNIFNFGDVYRYVRTPRLGGSAEQCVQELKRTTFTIPSEKAKLAMFNCFDLGFATIRTHDSSELRESLKTLRTISDENIKVFTDCFDALGGWCPGVRDAIGCWATASMPRVVTKNDKGEYDFKGVFSARTTGPLMGDTIFAAMLLGGEPHRDDFKKRFDSIDSVKDLTEWAKGYLASLHPDKSGLVHRGLRWVALQEGNVNVMLENIPTPYSKSEECLEGMLFLDQHLDAYLFSLCPSEITSSDRQEFKKKFCSRQIECQHKFRDEMGAARRDFGGDRPPGWHSEADRVGSRLYRQLAYDMAHSLGGDNTLAQKIVMNRLMRASLWCVHNGNASVHQRSLECTLSSRWLDQNVTIHLY